MKLAGPGRQLCTPQLLCCHKSAPSRGCHICFSHSHILYERLYAKDDPLEVSARFRDFWLLWDGTGSMCVGRHQEVCKIWSSGSFRRLLHQTVLLWCRHPRWAATAHFHHSLFAESNAVRRSWSCLLHVCSLCTHLGGCSAQTELRALITNTPHILGMLVLHQVLEFTTQEGRPALTYDIKYLLPKLLPSLVK